MKPRSATLRVGHGDLPVFDELNDAFEAHDAEEYGRIAGAMLETAEQDIEFALGRFVVKGGIGPFEVAAGALGDGIPSDLRGPLMAVSP